MRLLAEISGNSLVWVVFQILIAAIIYWVVSWGVGQIVPPEPFAKVIRVIMAVLVCLFLINALLSLGGHPLMRWGP